ncbi:MAG: SDR family NAD(P)-dependent oxidoreductase [Chloroflexi bacterium]|nr:SDR family NAD(P)-dependent oxidoreductase [Chloroflexota bacterium]
MRIKRMIALLGAMAGSVYWLARYLRPQHSTLILTDKVVLITGASTGIGRALAFAFARRGARVALVSRSEERLEAVRREIAPYSADVLVIPSDLTDEAQLEAAVARTMEHFGRIDVLVNNAGYMQGGPLPELDPARIEQVLRLNLWAMIRLTQLALPIMRAQHSGYILNIGSSAARVAVPHATVYVASKHGVAGFTDALRRELGSSGVRVTLVNPAWTDTDGLTSETQEVIGRYGFQIADPDEVAERAVQALVSGRYEIVLGGPLERLGVLVERYAPFLLRVYWRLFLREEWGEAMRGLGGEDAR